MPRHVLIPLLLAFAAALAAAAPARAQDALYLSLAAHPIDPSWLPPASGFGPIVHDPIPAKAQFGFVIEPTKAAPAPIGSYARGCLTGAVALPPTGPYWQIMRPSRNRNWGHPELLDFIETFATDMHEREGWTGLLIGDMSQPRGGPMLTGHASHQIGLDVDIWYRPMPIHVLTPEDRETAEPELLAEPGGQAVLPDHWNESWFRLLRRAASYPVVARIFVHPTIKKALCAVPTTDRAWMSKVRAYSGHNDHFHVRIHCPPNSPGCIPQEDPGKDDGCGQELAYWMHYVSAPLAVTQAPNPPEQAPVSATTTSAAVSESPAAPPAAPAPAKPAPMVRGPVVAAAPKPHQLMLAEMPAACAGVLGDGKPALLTSVAPSDAPLPPSIPGRDAGGNVQ